MGVIAGKGAFLRRILCRGDFDASFAQARDAGGAEARARCGDSFWVMLAAHSTL